MIQRRDQASGLFPAATGGPRVRREDSLPAYFTSHQGICGYLLRPGGQVGEEQGESASPSAFL